MVGTHWLNQPYSAVPAYVCIVAIPCKAPLEQCDLDAALLFLVRREGFLSVHWLIFSDVATRNRTRRTKKT